jgi:hypothetical protein
VGVAFTGGPSLALLTALIVNGFFGQVRVSVCRLPQNFVGVRTR